MDYKRKITIEITEKTIYDSIIVKQYEEGYPIEFIITNNGKEADLTNVVAIFELKKPDNTIVIEQCSISENVISFNLSKQMTIIDGKGIFQLTLFDASTYIPNQRESAVIITSATGVFRIQQSTVLNGDIESSKDVINILSDIIVQLEEAKYTTQLSKSYAVGGSGIAGRENEDTDNSKYYYEQIKALIDSIENGNEVKY